MKRPEFDLEGAHADFRGINPLEKAYAPRVEAMPVHCTDPKGRRTCRLTLLALAILALTLRRGPVLA